MARVACHSREKMSIEWFHFVLLFHSIQYYFPQTTAVESHSQGKVYNCVEFLLDSFKSTEIS